VIRYRIPLVGLGAELRLTKRVGFETLLYQLEERVADHGKLIFNIAPTADGNSKLSIYAAFDYKKGDSVAGLVLWEGTKVLWCCFRNSCTASCGTMPCAASRIRLNS
jgi:hypothetical protein